MRILFGLLFCCGAVSAQTIKDSAFIKIIADLPAAEPFDTAHSYRRVNQPYVYIISDKDIYKNFGWQLSAKYREFDFSNYHILGRQACRQCLLYCRHDEDQTACHRNRCSIGWVWLMRENKKAFTEVSSVTLPGHVEAKLPEGRHSFFGDTIISSSADSMTRWYTHGGGDCHARFEYSVSSDKYYPVLLLTERNFWGGCRAGGSWNFTVSFKVPPGILYHSKNIILMEKYRN